MNGQSFELMYSGSNPWLNFTVSPEPVEGRLQV
jgi:hypothetical protein